jgi:hypothetical protein
MQNFKVGQVVEYASYGAVKLAGIVRISNDGKILHLDNGRWMFAESCKLVTVNGD